MALGRMQAQNIIPGGALASQFIPGPKSLLGGSTKVLVEP